jgi:hypothetical protein
VDNEIMDNEHGGAVQFNSLKVRDIDNEVVILHEDTSLKGHFGIAQ